MKIKLIDQLHISEVSSDTLPGGSVVDVSDSTGADLVKRGLATKVGGAKAASAPRNKAAPVSRNKASATGRGRK
jgi:hypothetical protein